MFYELDVAVTVKLRYSRVQAKSDRYQIADQARTRGSTGRNSMLHGIWDDPLTNCILCARHLWRSKLLKCPPPSASLPR